MWYLDPDPSGYPEAVPEFSGLHMEEQVMTDREQFKAERYRQARELLTALSNGEIDLDKARADVGLPPLEPREPTLFEQALERYRPVRLADRTWTIYDQPQPRPFIALPVVMVTGIKTRSQAYNIGRALAAAYVTGANAGEATP